MVKSWHITCFIVSVVIFVMGMPRCVPLAPVVYFNKEGGVLCTNQFHCPENRVHVSIGGTYHCSLTEKRPYQHLCWHGRKSFKACFTLPFLSLYSLIFAGNLQSAATLDAYNAPGYKPCEAPLLPRHRAQGALSRWAARSCAQSDRSISSRTERR